MFLYLTIFIIYIIYPYLSFVLNLYMEWYLLHKIEFMNKSREKLVQNVIFKISKNKS